MSRPNWHDGTDLLITRPQSVAAGVFAVISSFLGVSFNLATIFALVGSPRLRKHPTTIFLMSLAISDAIFAGYNLPLTAHRYFHRGCAVMFDSYEDKCSPCENMCLPWQFCRFFPFFFYGNIGVSVLTMAAIAIQRVFGVFMGHLLDKVFNQLTVILMVIFVWLLSFGLMYFPLTEIWGQFSYEHQTFSCTLVESEGKSFMPFLMGVGCGIPIVIMAISYGAITWKVRATGKATRLAAGEDEHTGLSGKYSVAASTRRREQELTFTLAILFISFVVCFLPYSLLAIFDPMPPSRNGLLHISSYIISWTSCFLNPIIYCLTNKYYREAYALLWKRVSGCVSKPVHYHTVSTHSTGVHGNSSSGIHGKITNIDEEEDILEEGGGEEVMQMKNLNC